jgi:alpha-amylase
MVNDLILLFEVHQPYRISRKINEYLSLPRKIHPEELEHIYFDDSINKEIFERVYKKCYRPATQILIDIAKKSKENNKTFKVSFSFSGIFLEQAQNYVPDFLDLINKLIDLDAIELIAQTYFHSLVSLFESHDEFIEQVKMQVEKIQELFGIKPQVFENTEFIYNNKIATTINKIGFNTMLTEGTEKILGWRNPNNVYKAKNLNLKLLLRNYRLSDDIGFRFTSKSWTEWPLTADKYSDWIKMSDGQLIVIAMDYETFGEHHWPESGIHDFLYWLPIEIWKRNINLISPSEAIIKYTPVDELDISENNTISWADEERDVSAWLGNILQKHSFNTIESMEKLVKILNNKYYLRLWRLLTTSDHYYYMSMKGGGAGTVHSYFSHLNSPLEAFIIFTRIITDLNIRIQEELRKTTYLYYRLVQINVPDDFKFNFYRGLGEPLEISARNLVELINHLKHIDLTSIEFHMERGDIARWIRDILGDNELATRINKLKQLHGEKLRNALINTLQDRIKELSENS